MVAGTCQASSPACESILRSILFLSPRKTLRYSPARAVVGENIATLSNHTHNMQRCQTKVYCSFWKDLARERPGIPHRVAPEGPAAPGHTLLLSTPNTQGSMCLRGNPGGTVGSLPGLKKSMIRGMLVLGCVCALGSVLMASLCRRLCFSKHCQSQQERRLYLPPRL